MSGKTVLITGTNRGIGLEAAKQFLKRGYTVISGVRVPEKQEDLQGDAVGPAKHLVVRIDMDDAASMAAAAKRVKEEFGISTIDIILNNAAVGVTKDNAFLVRDSTPAMFQDAFHTNTLGTLNLFTNFYPFLPTDRTGKFVGVSTLAAVASNEHWPLSGPYALSKNAVNYLIGSIHAEEKHLTAFTISPGWVDTDMGYGGAEAFGVTTGPPEKVSVTVPLLVDQVEQSTREKVGARMINYDGSIFPY